MEVRKIVIDIDGVELSLTPDKARLLNTLLSNFLGENTPSVTAGSSGGSVEVHPNGS